MYLTNNVQKRCQCCQWSPYPVPLLHLYWSTRPTTVPTGTDHYFFTGCPSIQKLQIKQISLTVGTVGWPSGSLTTPVLSNIIFTKLSNCFVMLDFENWGRTDGLDLIYLTIFTQMSNSSYQVGWCKICWKRYWLFDCLTFPFDVDGTK